MNVAEMYDADEEKKRRDDEKNAEIRWKRLRINDG